MSHYLIHGPARRSRLIAALAAIAWSGLAPATEPQALIEASVKNTPSPPWPAGDERGMANAIGPGTWARCAWHLSQPQARVVEVSHVRSNTMPMSPFSGPYVQQFAATVVLPGTAHAFNNEHYAAGAQPSSQGTQIDALGHFGYLPQPWDGKPPAPVESTRYYGGFGQSDVKPSAESPLLKLGAERIP
ncbi:MAG TPA: hypothetical protein VM491_10430, partial [Burkholderiaceae bacterium]|nr:hypothetical protein [Burkholderiaceae bacterium]